MGIALVQRAIAYAVDIPVHPNEYRLLIGMCARALDQDNPPRYFAAREESALFLGRRVPDAVAKSDPSHSDVERERKVAFKRLEEAMTGLMRLGAVKSVTRGGNGRRAVRAIVLDVSASKATDEYQRRSCPPSNGQVAPRRTGDLPPVERGVAPRRTGALGTRGEQDQQQEETRPNETTSLDPVDNSNENDLEEAAA